MGSVDRTYDVAGLLLVIGALVVFAATAVVWYSGRVRDRESTERIAAARRDAATANQMTAVLEKEAALLRLDLEKERAKTGPKVTHQGACSFTVHFDGGSEADSVPMLG